MDDIRRSLIEVALAEGDVESWYREHCSVDLVSLLATIDENTLASIFLGLLKITRNVIPKLFIDNSVYENRELYLECEKTMISACNTIQTVAILLNTYAEDASNNLPASFMANVALLHEALLPVPDTIKEGRQAKSRIIQLCEKLYLQKRPGSEITTPAVIMSLLFESVDSKYGLATETLLKRIWALRMPLASIDFEDEDNGGLLELILKCFIDPSYTRSETGRKLLGFFFTLSPHVLKLAHGVIKSCFPLPARAQDTYANVYFRAWTSVSHMRREKSAVASTRFGGILHVRKDDGGGEERDQEDDDEDKDKDKEENPWNTSSAMVDLIEKDCLQDLLYNAIHSENQGMLKLSYLFIIVP